MTLWLSLGYKYFVSKIWLSLGYWYLMSTICLIGFCVIRDRDKELHNARNDLSTRMYHLLG